MLVSDKQRAYEEFLRLRRSGKATIDMVKQARENTGVGLQDVRRAQWRIDKEEEIHAAENLTDLKSMMLEIVERVF